jgi:hypothetical protein
MLKPIIQQMHAADHIRRGSARLRRSSRGEPIRPDPHRHPQSLRKKNRLVSKSLRR